MTENICEPLINTNWKSVIYAAITLNLYIISLTKDTQKIWHVSK